MIYRYSSKSPLGHISEADFHYDGVGVQKRRLLGAYVLVYLFNGNGFYEDSEHGATEVQAGDFIILFPDVPHRYGSSVGNWDEFYIVFEGPIFDLLRSTGVLASDNPVYRVGAPDVWTKRMTDIVDVPTNDGDEQQILMVGRLVALLTQIVSKGPVELNINAYKWLSTAYFWLGANLGQRFDYEWLADLIGISYDRFRKRFTHETGMSPRQYRDTKRIEFASGLLKNTKLSVKEIAGMVGFCDEFAFSNRFKSLTGRSPRNYRREVT